MSTSSALAESPAAASPAASTISPAAPPGWPWRRAALFPAGAAQLITISDLVSAAPIAATWSSLLLAITPVPVAAAAAFAPAPVNLLAAVAGVAVLVVGVAAQVTHTGVFFVPSLAALAVGAVKLWREQSRSRGEGAVR
jgi:hypothetical protein